MALSAALGLSLIGCGSEGEQETPKKEWAYVPEFLTLDAEEVSFWDMKAVGDYLYYSSYTYDEETGAGDLRREPGPAIGISAGTLWWTDK